MPRKLSAVLLDSAWRSSAPYLFIVWGLPFAGLALAGLWWLFQEGWFLWFIGFMVIVSALPMLYFLIANIRPKEARDLEIPIEALCDAEWAEADRLAFIGLSDEVKHLALARENLDQLWDDTLTIMSTTSIYYKKGRTSFSAAEILTLIERVAHNYLQELERFGFLSKIPLGFVDAYISHNDKIEAVKRAWKIYRKMRIFTPTGFFAEVRAMMTDPLWDKMSVSFKSKLISLLYLEILKASVSLYSGQYRSIEHPSKRLKNDQAIAEQQLKIEPIRVVIVGQSNAGKSTLVNTLLQGCDHAATGIMSTTDKAHVYEWVFEDTKAYRVVDLPGYTAQEKSLASTVSEMIDSDLVLWMVKATQPARKPDAELLKLLNQRVERSKTFLAKPMIVGLITHGDQLPPKSDGIPDNWLASPDPKSHVIREAKGYIESMLGFKDAYLMHYDEKTAQYSNDISPLLVDHYTLLLNHQMKRRKRRG
ncbi:50S ribosome-binding GTPase [Salinispirillum sp. LH 10-3-1]|uniref:50S ribosome-binding GTPase n=1 Tax=Salinispirillum sp. LH 10-3-1 TaxID=2952525 RepID=A0AB38YBK3_9GAMM